MCKFCKEYEIWKVINEKNLLKNEAMKRLPETYVDCKGNLHEIDFHVNQVFYKAALVIESVEIGKGKNKDIITEPRPLRFCPECGIRLF
jgi:hypothetical protein